ncbi:MAG: MBL fold metallo-hydrolase [Defluviitaleaceae bacterium]|nr:MBL fold metallo-hydrolase [Defluviitaleaceae bacterium]
MAKLLYQGHGSFRLTSDGGEVMFIDPYAGGGYEIPADAALVTHAHADHNRLELIVKKPGCAVITQDEALAGGKHNSFTVGGFEIEAVEAGNNKGHSIDDSVGYIVRVDGLGLYFCGDTSTTSQMSKFAPLKLDYAFLCADGIYNMDLSEAAECARLIGAKRNVPVHLKPGKLFDREMAERFEGPDKFIIEAGAEIVL